MAVANVLKFDTYIGIDILHIYVKFMLKRFTDKKLLNSCC